MERGWIGKRGIGSNPIGATFIITDVKRCQKVRIQKWSKRAIKLFFLLLTEWTGRCKAAVTQ